MANSHCGLASILPKAKPVATVQRFLTAMLPSGGVGSPRKGDTTSVHRSAGSFLIPFCCLFLMILMLQSCVYRES